MLNQILDSLQAKFPPNRLVALAMVTLLPFIASGAGYLAVWVPAHFPGLPPFTAAQLTAFGVATVSGILLAGITAGYRWLDGWQKDEARRHDTAQKAAEREHQKVLAVLESPIPDLARDTLDQLETTPESSALTSELPVHPLASNPGTTFQGPQTPPQGFSDPPDPF